MSSKTKIVVLHMKEIVYTIIFAIFALLIIGLLCSMFIFNKKPQGSASYNDGIYSADTVLGDTSLTVEVSINNSKIDSIRISNLDDAVTSMYPLLQPTIEELALQICETQSTKNIMVSDSNKNTAKLLLSSIESALKKATVD